MAARTQVTGPILHFVGFPGDESQVFYFLGTSKISPQIRVDRHYLPVMFEQGGYVLPMDLAYQGKEAKIVTQLNLFDQQMAYFLGCSPRYTKSRFAMGRGLDSYHDTGSLTLGNKGYFSLYLQFPFAETANSPQDREFQFDFPVGPNEFDMPRIYRFPACVVEYDEQIGGSGAQELTLAIHAQRIYYSRSKYKNAFHGSGLAGGFFLYDHRPDLATRLPKPPYNLGDPDVTPDLVPRSVSMPIFPTVPSVLSIPLPSPEVIPLGGSTSSTNPVDLPILPPGLPFG